MIDLSDIELLPGRFVSRKFSRVRKQKLTTIAVPVQIHLLIKLYASEKDIPIQDAVVELLDIAFRQVYNSKG